MCVDVKVRLTFPVDQERRIAEVVHPRGGDATLAGRRLRRRPSTPSISASGSRTDAEIKVPINWFDCLARTSDALRRDVEVIEGRAGLWWEQLEEGLSVPGLFGLPEFPE